MPRARKPKVDPLAHACPECMAPAGKPCVYYTGKPTDRPHKTRGPGKLDAHLQAEIDRRVTREKASYGPLFQDLAAAEMKVPTVADLKSRKRFEAARGAEQRGLLDKANEGMEWIRLHHIRRTMATLIGDWWADRLWGYAVRVYMGNESYILGFLANCLTTADTHRVGVELRNDPARAKVSKWTNANGVEIEFRHNGDYLHDTLVWPPYFARLPVMTREEFDRRFPKVDHRDGLKDAPEPDDGGLFERMLTLLRKES